MHTVERLIHEHVVEGDAYEDEMQRRPAEEDGEEASSRMTLPVRATPRTWLVVPPEFRDVATSNHEHDR